MRSVLRNRRDELIGQLNNGYEFRQLREAIIFPSHGEIEFLSLLTELKQFSGIYNYLQVHSDTVSVNCRDYTGQSALDIAVGLHDEVLVEDLLSLDNISISHLYGAILTAVQESELGILETLLDVYERRNTSTSNNEKWNPTGFGMTPIMAAASEGKVKITKYLLDRGHTIEKPHHPTCSCENSDCLMRSQEGETLFQSLRRINAYKALANPVYIMLTSEDPFLTAFTLSRELSSLAGIFPEHKNKYTTLADECQQFSADLLDQCQDTNEVKTVMVQRKGFPDPRPRQFSRLQLAVRDRQKMFVAHPSCQQVLGAAWVSGLPKWWSWSSQRRLAHIILHIISTPFVALTYIVFPTSCILNPIKVPLNRFIYSVTSYIIFLAFLLITIMDDEPRERQTNIHIFYETAIAAWVLGHFWELVLDMYLLGMATFMKSWWLVYDLIMFTGFLVAELIFLLVVTLDLMGFTSNPSPRSMWPWYHPFLLSEGIFALFTVMAFCRLLLWYQVLSKLGPLGTSLRYMLGDVLRFLLVVCVFLIAFALGINFIYKNYKGNVKYYPNGTNKTQPAEFVTLQSAFKTLFWAGLGMASPDVAAVVIPGPNDAGHRFTEILGYSLWALYHVVTVVVLLNMLIAMMADSYTRVQRNADVEWKFARSSVLLAFFDKQSALPPPFNLLPTLYGTVIFMKSIREMIKNNVKGFRGTCCNWQTDAEKELQKKYEEAYQDLIRQLIQRYIHHVESTQRKERINAFSADQIQRLKSQIVSEIRKENINVSKETT